MKISDNMLKCLRDCEASAISQADSFAQKASQYRDAAEELERDAMQARLDAEAWRETLERYERTEDAPAEQPAVSGDDYGTALRAASCSCGLPGIPGMTHGITECVEMNLMERLVAGRPPYENPTDTAVMPLGELEALDAGNGTL